MIVSFRHKGLKALYEGKGSAKLNQERVPKLIRIISALDEATMPGEMDLPGYNLHPLKADLKGHFAVSVSGNWRVTFRFKGENVADVNFVDYH